MADISTVVAEIVAQAVRTARYAYNEDQGVEDYLRGRECASLIALLCNLEHTERASVEVGGERKRLATAFAIEVTRAAERPYLHTRIDRQSHELWAEIEQLVRQKITKVEATDKIVIRVTGPERSINERLGLAEDPRRRTAARMTGAAIREAMADAHERMMMPHSRTDFRFFMEQIYVPRGLVLDGDRSWLSTPVSENLVTARRFVVVGNPGAGKSTFIRNLIRRVAVAEDAVVPLLVLLKQHQQLEDDFVSIIARELRPLVQRQVARGEIADLLSSGDGLVVFDGLDEVGDVQSRRAAVTAIEAFAARFPLARIVVTCRIESYPVATLDPVVFPVYWLPHFDQEQVECYVNAWFSLVPHYGETRAEPFLRDSEELRTLRRNPLMLSLLCMLYQSEGYIPANTADVYRECAELMLVRWDAVSQVPSVIKSSVKLAKFLVQELAQHFFFELDGREVEGEHTLRRLVVRHLRGREEETEFTYHQQAQDFLNFCAERAWVLTQIDTGLDGERMFGFTHRTFMEYYTACHVLRKHEGAPALVKCLLPLITSGKSHVVPLIALQMFDINRADGADTCVSLLLDEYDRHGQRTIITFCMSFYSYNHLRQRTAGALLERSFELDGRTGAQESFLPAEKKARLDAVARDVLLRTNGRRYEFAEIRLGAGLNSGDQLARYEVELAKIRFGHRPVSDFVVTQGARNLVWTWLGGEEPECVPGPVVQAVGDVAWRASWAPRGSLTPVTAALPECVPMPLSVVPRMVEVFDRAGSGRLHEWFRSGKGGFTGLLCLVAAAAWEAGLAWDLPERFLDLRGVLVAVEGTDRRRYGARLLAYCDDSAAMQPFRRCLTSWARGEMAFVDGT